jgi:hypothetical protein
MLCRSHDTCVSYESRDNDSVLYLMLDSMMLDMRRSTTMYGPVDFGAIPRKPRPAGKIRDAHDPQSRRVDERVHHECAVSLACGVFAHLVHGVEPRRRREIC